MGVLLPRFCRNWMYVKVGQLNVKVHSMGLFQGGDVYLGCLKELSTNSIAMPQWLQPNGYQFLFAY